MNNLREFDDVYCWNSNPGEAFKVKEGVFIMKTLMGKYEVACKGDPCNTTWDCCIKMSNVPEWGLLPKYESSKPEVKAGDLAYVNNGCLLRMVLDVNDKIFCLYTAATPCGAAVKWDTAVLHTSAEDLEFMCNEAQVLSDVRAGKPKIGDEVLAWDDGDTGRHIGTYVNHTGSETRPYQVKCGVYTGFFDNIMLHTNNAPTVEGYLDSALAIFDEGGSKSDTLVNLLDMTLKGMRVSKLNAELEGNIMTAISIDCEIDDLKSLFKDIRSGDSYA